MSNQQQNDKQPSKADEEKRVEQRQAAIKGLVVIPDEELQRQEDQLWQEKQNYFQDQLVKVSNLRRVLHVLRDDLQKYPNIAKQYDTAKTKYDAALKESQEKEEEINNKIQNIQAARLVKRDAAGLNAQQKIDDAAVKAAVEGQKPFTPQVTPDENFDLVALTKGVASDLAKEPAEGEQKKEGEASKPATADQTKKPTTTESK